MHDLAVEGEFNWVEDGSPVEFDNWGTQQPSGGDSEDCVLLQMNDGKFHDNPCSTGSRHLCQLRLTCP